jgi:hypothetical protein
MSKTTKPIPTRFGEGEAEIRETARKCGISIQDTIRIAVGFGLPVVLSRLARKGGKNSATLTPSQP